MFYELIDYWWHSAQVIAVARTADLVLMMLDATKQDVQRGLLEKELESVGIRLNKKKPNIYFKVSTSSFNVQKSLRT
jgi:ribosome-interacting GTPase 1